MDDERLVELLRMLAPAPTAWVAEAEAIADFAEEADEDAPEDDGVGPDEASADDGPGDFVDAEEPGEPGSAPADDDADPWSV